jgi:hypothetical protein
LQITERLVSERGGKKVAFWIPVRLSGRKKAWRRILNFSSAKKRRDLLRLATNRVLVGRDAV